MNIWQRLRSFTKKLCVFTVFNLIVVNLILLFLFDTKTTQTVPFHVFSFFTFNATFDSWWPMQFAFDHLDVERSKLLYDSIFFEQKTKFQYPITSLLVFPILKLFIPESAFGITLNAISWFAIIITAIFVIKIFISSVKKSSIQQGYNDVSDYLSRTEIIIVYDLLFLLTLSFYPVIKAYTLGQIQVWINCLFTIIVWCWLKDKKRIAGVLTGLMGLMKPQYIIILIWGGLRKQWNFVFPGLAVLGLGLLTSIALFGLMNHLNYLSVLSYISKHGEVYYANQSVNGLLNRLIFPGRNLRFFMDAFAPFNRWVYFGTLTSSLLLLTVALFGFPRSSLKGSTIDLSIIAITATIASPVAWEHHYGIFLPIYGVLFPPLLIKKNGKSLFFLATSYILVSNNLHFINLLTYNKKYNFLQSYLFFAGLMVLGYCYFLIQKNKKSSLDSLG